MRKIISERDLISEERKNFSNYKRAVADDCHKAKMQPAQIAQPAQPVPVESRTLANSPFPILGALVDSASQLAQSHPAASTVLPQSAKDDDAQPTAGAESDQPESYASGAMRRAKGAGIASPRRACARPGSFRNGTKASIRRALIPA